MLYSYTENILRGHHSRFRRYLNSRPSFDMKLSHVILFVYNCIYIGLKYSSYISKKKQMYTMPLRTGTHIAAEDNLRNI